jgi:organic hydroperoxide reductase OsmC/OhrA
MEISARIRNAAGENRVTVATGGTTQSVAIAARTNGPGSSVNGGELLMLALATCYCNDVYREAARMNIPIAGVEVEARGDFDGIGLGAANVRYRARVESSAAAAVIEALLERTDAVAEIHRTLRAGVQVSREPWRSATSP